MNQSDIEQCTNVSEDIVNYPEQGLVLKTLFTVIYAIIFTLGLLGNGSTIFVTFRNSSLHNVQVSRLLKMLNELHVSYGFTFMIHRLLFLYLRSVAAIKFFFSVFPFFRTFSSWTCRLHRFVSAASAFRLVLSNTWIKTGTLVRSCVGRFHGRRRVSCLYAPTVYVPLHWIGFR